MTIADNIAAVRARIRSACQRFGRDPADVQLLAVSKTRTQAEVQGAIDAGQHDFGENYLQDALTKTPHLDVVWHFIGAIQSNKTRSIAQHFSWVHTLSSLKVATRLDAQRPEHLPPLKALIQVNIDDDPSKAGLAAGDVATFLSSTRALNRIDICGLMTIPSQAAPGESDLDTRKPFARLRELRDSLAPGHPALTELSMGMSDDLEAAIAEGATWVRIGTAIFGPRQSPAGPVRVTQ